MPRRLTDDQRQGLIRAQECVRQCEQELASALEKRDAKIAKAVHQWGISHADIGRLLNLTRQAVHTAVQRAIDRP